jgi:hypothetical protein
VNADRHWVSMLRAQQFYDRRRDRFVVEQVYARFIVGKDHPSSPSDLSVKYALSSDVQSARSKR